MHYIVIVPVQLLNTVAFFLLLFFIGELLTDGLDLMKDRRALSALVLPIHNTVVRAAIDVTTGNSHYPLEFCVFHFFCVTNGPKDLEFIWFFIYF